MRENNMIIEFDSRSENEGFARVAVAAFVTPLNPTLEEIEDVKTAVSEAVTNSVIHGYGERVEKIILKASIKENTVSIEITDFGCGIENIEKAMEPMYTTRPDLERSGMGFAFMEAFMDEIHIESEVNKGTTIYMNKKIMG
ncbi:MAG: anti-sigma F factor [Lachnospiraceae bacterium]|nr:anti-sigma F factor [Lachnospiraceae bacterium]